MPVHMYTQMHALVYMYVYKHVYICLYTCLCTRLYASRADGLWPISIEMALYHRWANVTTGEFTDFSNALLCADCQASTQTSV